MWEHFATEFLDPPSVAATMQSQGSRRLGVQWEAMIESYHRNYTCILCCIIIRLSYDVIVGVGYRNCSEHTEPKYKKPIKELDCN